VTQEVDSKKRQLHRARTKRKRRKSLKRSGLPDGRFGKHLNPASPLESKDRSSMDLLALVENNAVGRKRVAKR